jgi:glycosyltransferase involved in cell wall biosynthesis
VEKICFVVSSPLTANVFLPNHINVLQKEFDVYVIANFDDGLTPLSLPQLDIYHRYHITIERNIHLINDIMALIRLQKYFKRMKFDVVHSVTPKAGLLAMVAAKLAGIKNRIHIFTGQVWYTKSGFLKNLLINFDRIIAKSATHILVDGESQRRFLIDQHIINDANSNVLGKGSISGVDVDRFTIDPSIREKIRKELSLADSDVVFGFLGRINKDKGILDLALAFKKLLLHYSNAKLLIIGFDEESLIPEVQNIVDNSSSVIFYGTTPKPEVVLQATDVFCLPSYREGFGTSVIEASLLGLPIICSDTYGLMDTIIENKTGLRHEVRNVSALHNQMRKLIESPDLRKYLGINGRNYVLENFSANNISSHWLKFYIQNFSNKNVQEVL